MKTQINKCGLSGMACLLGIAVAPVYADVTPNPYVTENGIEILPYLDVELLHDDNVTNQQESSATIDSWASIVSPGVLIELEPGFHKYVVGYRIERGDYFSSQEDNYTDHFVELSADWELNQRNRLGLYYDFAATHEGRGEGITEGIGGATEEVLKYRTKLGGIKYGFGGMTATGRIEVGAAYYDKHYSNFRNATRFRDFNESRYSGAFYYRVAPKTSLLFELLKNDKRYDEVAPGADSRDSDDHYIYVGATWDTTSAVTGVAKLGYQYKDFEASGRESFEDISWDLGLTWKVKEYSKFDFGTKRQAKDPDQAGDYIQESFYRFAWQHYWLERLSSTVSWTYTDDKYRGVTRHDKTDDYFVGFNYDIRRWVNLGLGYNITDKRSSSANIGYDKNVFRLSVKVVM